MRLNSLEELMKQHGESSVNYSMRLNSLEGLMKQHGESFQL